MILKITIASLVICIIARLTNFGLNTIFYSPVVVPLLIIHLVVQYKLAKSSNRIDSIALSILSNIFLVLASILIPDGVGMGSYAVFGLIRQPSEDFLSAGIVLFFLGFILSLISLGGSK